MGNPHLALIDRLYEAVVHGFQGRKVTVSDLEAHPTIGPRLAEAREALAGSGEGEGGVLGHLLTLCLMGRREARALLSLVIPPEPDGGTKRRERFVRRVDAFVTCAEAAGWPRERLVYSRSMARTLAAAARKAQPAVEVPQEGSLEELMAALQAQRDAGVEWAIRVLERFSEPRANKPATAGGEGKTPTAADPLAVLLGGEGGDEDEDDEAGVGEAVAPATADPLADLLGGSAPEAQPAKAKAPKAKAAAPAPKEEDPVAVVLALYQEGKIDAATRDKRLAAILAAKANK